MSKRSREKWFWKNFFGIKNPKKAPEHIKNFGARLENITDEDLDFLTQRVKTIEVVTLGENPISGRGIHHLTRLNYVKELDLKGLVINDEVSDDLVRIPGVERLHIKHTEISLEGIRFLLSHLRDLKTLIFSLDHSHRNLGEVLQEEFPGIELRY